VQSLLHDPRTWKRSGAFSRLMASNDRTGNLPAMPGIYPDYSAPIVRNGGGGRELAIARWGMPSSQKVYQQGSFPTASMWLPASEEVVG